MSDVGPQNTQNNYAEALRILNDVGVEYMSATSDAMFKKLFVQSSDTEKVKGHRELVIKVVSNVIGLLDKESNYSVLISGEKLVDREIRNTELVDESVNARVVEMRANTKGAKRNTKRANKKSNQDTPAVQYTNLPENPKVDCTSRVTLDGDEEIFFDVEMQVSKNQKSLMGSRLPHYGEYLSQLKLGKDVTERKARKVFSTALYMWNCDESDKVGVIWGTPRECFTSADKGLSYPDVKFPVCCVQIFLGETIRALEIIGRAWESIKDLINDVNAQRSVIQKALKERTEELARKLLGSNIDEMRGGFLARKGGYEESDFANDPELLKKFRKVETFEMMQLIAASSAMTAEEVDNILSKEVKSIYEDLKVTEENIVNDVYLEKETEWLNLIEAAETKATAATAVANGKTRVLKEIKKVKHYNIDNKEYQLSKADLNRLLPDEDLCNRVIMSIVNEEEDEDERYELRNGDLIVTEKSASLSQEAAQEPVGVKN